MPASSATLVGGPADGYEAPALPRVHVPLLAAEAGEYVVDYEVQKIARPFDPGRPDATEHPPEPWRHPNEQLTYWTFRVWLHPDRFREVNEQLARMNRAALRAGGYLLLQEEAGTRDVSHERAAFEFERDRLLAMLEPGWTDTKEADMTVWKFLIPRPGANGIKGVALVDMPPGAQPLSAGIQGDDIVVWALVDSMIAGLPKPHRFFVINTGDHAAIPSRARFLDTVTHQPSGVVWHVFDDGLGARA